MADTQIESTAQATLLATFFVGDALCALDAAGVQAVIRVESVTQVRNEEDRNEFLGILVDRAGEVMEVEPGQEESLPINIPAAQSRFFQQVCQAGGHVIAVLNPREILNESSRQPSGPVAVSGK